MDGMIRRSNGSLGWGYENSSERAENGYGAGKNKESLSDLEDRLGKKFPRFFSDHYIIINFDGLNDLWVKNVPRKNQPNVIGYSEQWSFLARRPGVYCFTKNGGAEVYVGETKDLGKRMKEHFNSMEQECHGFVICRITGVRGNDFLLSPGVRANVEAGLKAAFHTRGKLGGAKTAAGTPRRDSWQVVSFEGLREIEGILESLVKLLNKKPPAFQPFLKKIGIFRFNTPIDEKFIENF